MNTAGMKRRRRVRRGKRPLWLTAQEAEALVLLSGGSLLDAGLAERVLFTKLGKYLRRF